MIISDLMRCVLSDKTIVKYWKKGLLVENPISLNQVQPNSLDLTLGTSVRKIAKNKHEVIDISQPIPYAAGEFTKDNNGKLSYIIQPKEFVLMASNEILNIPNGILSFVQGRSSVARLGIQTEQAGLIDAGFRGTITFEVYNQTNNPIKLYKGMRIAQVYFFKAQKALKPYSKSNGNKYRGQLEARGSQIFEDSELQK